MRDSLRHSSRCCTALLMFPLRFLVALTALLTFCASTARCGDIDDAQRLFKAGDYEQCLAAAQKSLSNRRYGRLGEEWEVLLTRSQLVLGQLDQAAGDNASAVARYPWSIRLRLLNHRISRLLGHDEIASAQLAEIDQRLRRTPWRYTDSANLIAAGDALLLLRAEPRDVLLNFYDRAKKEAPDRVDAYLAIGRLALRKHDDALAAEEFRAAAKEFPNNPEVQYGLARALVSGDGKAAEAALKRALEINPRHVPSLLLTAEQLIDAERYVKAEAVLKSVLEVNPRQREAWAYRALLAHYAADPKGEQVFRGAARGRSNRLADVDHLIGRKLSRNYRFREGAAYQRRALEQDADFTPATIQLAQDLLRLGEEEEGWQLARRGFERDGYDVVSFNLVTLQENISKYRTLEDDDFIVRMEAREAEIYGRRVLALLQRAKESLCVKYHWTPSQPIIVEIFADQSDFAVRTFGMPGGAGFLGVCFGNVITANSPATQAGNPTNWESVLWHEFCHTVTLNLTHNKMPRWLSEGISVYEEQQADSRWGQSMTPQYRKWILGGDFTPVSELSSAFSSPPSGAHLQFAYYQSSLVVEYLIETFGFDVLREILADLGAGMPINVSLERRTNGLAALERDFAMFARARAEALAPDADWSEPQKNEQKLLQIAHTDPLKSNNIQVLARHCRELLAAKHWQAAKQPLQRLIGLYPEHVGSGNAYAMLARVHRELGEVDQETEVLERWASLSADAVDAYERLLELAAQNRNWAAVRTNAERLLAINPLHAAPHAMLARASGELGQVPAAAEAYQAVVRLDAHRATEAHYQLARILQTENPRAAKTHLLRALEAAPRYREAHRLLLKIHRTEEETKREAN